ncbi:phage holin [Siminovitchia terrae]|uniref:phage holin n=1 Tax=Siminovitchia terrae TaxID=1914933 RepID=UPI0028AC80DD|nr:phage holin [Siminovitchia terrae]
MQQAIIRLAVLVIALINQTLTMLGWNPLPFSDEQIYEGVSATVTVVVSVWVWWKNNSITEEAQVADNHMRAAKHFKRQNKE